MNASLVPSASVSDLRARAVSLTVSKFNWPYARTPVQYYPDYRNSHLLLSPLTTTPPPPRQPIQAVAISIWPSVIRTSPNPVRWPANDLSMRDDCARLKTKHSEIGIRRGGRSELKWKKNKIRNSILPRVDGVSRVDGFLGTGLIYERSTPFPHSRQKTL